jgi:hypothetical protein
MEKKVAATKKNPKRFTHLGFGSLLPQKSGFFSWAAGVGGWGAAQPGLIRRHNAPSLFNASCWFLNGGRWIGAIRQTERAQRAHLV